jgi:hypothetical protein
MLAGMSDERDLSEEELAQAFSDGWARRILNCVKPACRRRRECTTPRGCPMLAAYPIPHAQLSHRLRDIRMYLKQRVDAIDGGPEEKAAYAAAKEVRREKTRRQRAESFRRVEEELRKTRSSGRKRG